VALIERVIDKGQQIDPLTRLPDRARRRSPNAGLGCYPNAAALQPAIAKVLP